jgi:hypothetical protein
MSYDCPDFVDDVMSFANRLLTPAERKRIEQAEDPHAAMVALCRILHAIPTPKPVRRSKRAYQPNDDLAIDHGLTLLRGALEAFKSAGAVKTAERVRSAISSAKGAVRAVGYRRGRHNNALRLKDVLL